MALVRFGLARGLLLSKDDRRTLFLCGILAADYHICIHFQTVKPAVTGYFVVECTSRRSSNSHHLHTTITDSGPQIEVRFSLS